MAGSRTFRACSSDGLSQKEIIGKLLCMNTTTGRTAFHPYKIIHQGRSTLQLAPGAGPKVVIFLIRTIPLLMAGAGVVLFIIEKETFLLLIFAGMAVLEGLVFSFIKVPASLSMDSMGFTLETLSMKGKQESYYLWNDVDFIRYRILRGKNSTTLNYAAILNTGKKISFLSFNNYHAKKHSIPEINSVLHNISNKELREK